MPEQRPRQSAIERAISEHRNEWDPLVRWCSSCGHSFVDHDGSGACMDSKCQCPIYQRECQPLDWHRPEHAFRLLEAMVERRDNTVLLDNFESDAVPHWMLRRGDPINMTQGDTLADAICLAYCRANNIEIPDQPARGE